MAQIARRFNNPALFICDVQEKFRPAIFRYGAVISTAQKMLRASKILDIPVFVTTQQRAKLGSTCSELQIDSPGGFAAKALVDKSRFSMWTPEIQTAIKEHSHVPQQPLQAVIVGIESHICVSQTALDLLAEGHSVYVLADGVSSCNAEEVPIALARLRSKGITVTTSESWLYECIGDSNIAEFREMVSLVKDTQQLTKENLESLCKI